MHFFFTKQLHRRNFSVNNDINCTLSSHKSLKRPLFGNRTRVIWLFHDALGIFICPFGAWWTCWRLLSFLCSTEEETWVWKETSLQIIWTGWAFINKWEIIEWPVFLMSVFLQSYFAWRFWISEISEPWSLSKMPHLKFLTVFMQCLCLKCSEQNKDMVSVIYSDCSVNVLHLAPAPYNPLALQSDYSIWSAEKLFQYDLLYFLFIAAWDLCYINSTAILFLLRSPMSLWEKNTELRSSVFNMCHRSLDALTIAFITTSPLSPSLVIAVCV